MGEKAAFVGPESPADITKPKFVEEKPRFSQPRNWFPRLFPVDRAGGLMGWKDRLCS